MAYLSTTASVRKIVDAGLYTGLAGHSTSVGAGSIYLYVSTHGATEIVATGFFTGAGAQPMSTTGALHPNIVSRHANNIGMRVGDLLCSVESSGGTNAWRVTWHAVTGSTFGGSTSVYGSSAGYDITVSAHAAT